MQRTLLMVDTSHGSHATRLAAMQAANAALVSYTLTDTVLSLPSGNYALIDCLVPNASRTGGIAWADRSNIGDDYFKAELACDANCSRYARMIISPTTYGKLRFVRQQQGFTVAADDYGNGDGLSWADAFNGPQDPAINTTDATHQGDTTYLYCGEIYRTQNTTISFSTQGDIPWDATGTPKVFGDYALDPGLVHGGFFDGRATGSWTADTTAGVYFQSDFHQQVSDVGDQRWGVTNADPTLDTDTLVARHLLKYVATLAECRAEAGTIFVQDPGTDQTAYVHLWDGRNPDSDGTRILRPDFGLQWVTKQNPQANGAEFRSITVLAMDAFDLIADGTNEPPDNLVMRGGRWIGKTDWFYRGAGTLWEFGDDPGGYVPYTISETKTDEGFQELINRWSTDGRLLDNLSQWIRFEYQANGPYYSQAVGSGGNLLGTMFGDGFIVRNTGIDLAGEDMSDTDNHSIACRGSCDGWTYKRFLLDTVAAAMNFYSSCDGQNASPANGSASDQANMTIQDGVIQTWNGRTDAELGAGLAGINFNGDNDTVFPMDDGTGDGSGNVVRRIAVLDLKPTAAEWGTTLGTPATVNEGEGLILHSNSDVAYSSISVIRCNHGIRGDRSGHIQALSAVIQEDNSAASFVDLTSNVWDDGSPTTSNFFPATEGTDDACYFGYSRTPFRRLDIRIIDAAAGTYTLAWEYWNGSAWSSLSVTDGTTDLTGSGVVTWTKPGDWATTTVNSQGPFYYVRVRLASGSFSTDPTFDRVRSVQSGYVANIDGIYFEDIEHHWFWSRSGLFSAGEHVVDIDNVTYTLKSGQAIGTTTLCRIGSGAGETAGTFQARTKSASTTDSPRDSVFMPTLSAA